MTEENKQPAPAAPTPEVQGPQESNDLTITDLNTMKMIIDIASSRGAFKPAEMVTVGQTYNKLSNFLASVAKQPQQAGV